MSWERYLPEELEDGCPLCKLSKISKVDEYNVRAGRVPDPNIEIWRCPACDKFFDVLIKKE
ncbi:MAG: hypothetical protein WBC70_07130 [Candidatus Aminicenantales bacterium]